MRKTLEFSGRKLSVMLDADVVVCGGGPAGAAAAIAAARTGARVLLIEQLGCFGGMGTAGLVPCFSPFTDGDKPIARGISEEVIAEMARRMGVPVEEWMPIQPEILKVLYDEMLASSGAAFKLSTKIVDVVAERRIEAVVLSTHEGLRAVTGRVFVDATGDGDVAAWAGAPYELGGRRGELQSVTLCMAFTGIDWAAYDAKRLPSGPRPDQLIWSDDLKDGRAPLAEQHLTTGVLKCGAAIAGNNVGHVYGVNGLNESDVTRAFVEGRKIAWTFLDWYRRSVPGCSRLEMAATASMLGVRETRRITGEYVLNFYDYLNRAGFPDEIGRCAYPVDVHSPTPDKRELEKSRSHFLETQYGPGESYGIPYRSLVPLKLENLLVAGRCVSCDRMIQGSLRTMPYCFVTGHAAGVAAALAATKSKGDVRAVDVAELRSTLKGQGAYIP